MKRITSWGMSDLEHGFYDWRKKCSKRNRETIHKLLNHGLFQLWMIARGINRDANYEETS